ncbi:MAG: hypothetical protein AAF570_02495 [Bacteroidota bacterium]
MKQAPHIDKQQAPQTPAQNQPIKWVFFAFILLFISLPLIQNRLGLFEEKPLHGKQEAAPAPEIKWSTWFDGSLQQGADRYLNENFGFRKSLVRLHNQLRFSLFSEARSHDVIVGEDSYLFGGSYIRAYFGADWIGRDSIDNQVARLKILHERLAAHGSHLVMVVAPGKASFFPEHIPSYFEDRYGPPGETNYKYYTQRLNEEGIPLIDMQSWFISMKDTSRFPLFTRGGIHWTYPASFLVNDSLLHYMEGVLGKDLPEVPWRLTGEDSVHADDRDLELTLNLMGELDAEGTSVPKYDVKAKGKHRPAVLTMADSFWWTIYSKGIPIRAYGGHQFWYYGAEVFRQGQPMRSATNFHLGTELRKHDVVILLCTEPKLKGFAWGFLQRAVEEIDEFPERDTLRQAFIEGEIRSMRSSEKWLKALEAKAEKWNMPLDSVLYQDAVYMWEKKKDQIRKAAREKAVLNPRDQ